LVVEIEVNNEKKYGLLGYTGDEILPSHVGDCNKPTSIQWKVSGFCLLRYLWRFFQVCLGLLGVGFDTLQSPQEKRRPFQLVDS